MLEKILKDAASATPDPERALKNLKSFCDRNHECIENLKADIKPISLLFSISQFLANFSFANPDVLFEAVSKMHESIDRKALHAALKSEFEKLSVPSSEALMGVVRKFKKKALLIISLRDILNIVGIMEAMLELSILADVIVEESLQVLQADMKEIYGEPHNDAFSVIAVGKLGSNELNFSSDIDLMYVYETEQGETSGTVTPQGSITNRISNYEYYCKLGENLNKLLSLNTEDGLAYRVDLRLRPEGQRGSLAMSLAAYEIYYESWGRAWERAVFLRARPVAGDMKLGKAFMEMIKPFVYRKYLDFNAIDEIRRMKKKIDEKFKKDDIKRGYGGIREIEFFTHALQLIYGGKEPILREMSIPRGLHMLLQKNLIGYKDYSTLSDNYMFLRTLEHRLQQFNDLQTHSLPSDEGELVALAKKMNFPDKESFLSELGKRRRMVRQIYDSLFMQGKHEMQEIINGAAIFFDEELSDSELVVLLRDYQVKNVVKAIRNIHQIKNSIYEFQTFRGRRLLGEVLPVFLNKALMSKDPDTALNNLQSFAAFLSSEESYLELFAGNKKLIPVLVRVFSQSAYLSRTIMKRPEYLGLLGHELFLKKTLISMKEELMETTASGRSMLDAIRIFRQMEEIRLGILFMDKTIDIVALIKGLSKTADAIVSVCCNELFRDNGLAVIGLGKAGGRELTFASDLDVIFVCKDRITEGHTRAAERFIRLLISYTKDGAAYKVDMRLRPEGTKGPLVSNIGAYRDYYLHAAHFWEFQALLKARPTGGDRDAGCHFMEMQRDILIRKAREVSANDIKSLRERIQKELSKEEEGYDIKLGPGGIEELEFTVQYLQLINLHKYTGLIVQGTLDAAKRLKKSGMIDKKEADFIKDTYIFYRTIESLMRLISEPVLKEDSAAAVLASEFMGFRDRDSFLKDLKERRAGTRDMFERYLR